MAKFCHYPVFTADEERQLVDMCQKANLRPEELIRTKLGFSCHIENPRSVPYHITQKAPVEASQQPQKSRPAGRPPLAATDIVKREALRQWSRQLVVWSNLDIEVRRYTALMKARRWAAEEFLNRVEAMREELMNKQAFEALVKHAEASTGKPDFTKIPASLDLPPKKAK